MSEAASLKDSNDAIQMDKLIRPALEKGVLLFNILVQVCSGKALAVLKVVPTGNGLEAWRLFCK
eukprot:12878489-Heterocapsa_arctica.AAC.1